MIRYVLPAAVILSAALTSGCAVQVAARDINAAATVHTTGVHIHRKPSKSEADSDESAQYPASMRKEINALIACDGNRACQDTVLKGERHAR